MDTRAALRMARGLLREHGLDDWTVTLDRAKTRAGVCRFARREIGLSGPITALHSEDDVRDTILHEIAHALVGPDHGHDRVWRAMARRIGCSGQRCTSADAPTVRGAWIGTCPAGHEVTRHRRPTRVTACVTCSPTFDPRAIFAWTHNGRPAPMLDSYRQELAAIRARFGSAVHARPAATAPAYAVGDVVRITRAGAYLGSIGVVELVTRSKAQVRVGAELLNAPFDVIEPAPSYAS